MKKRLIFLILVTALFACKGGNMETVKFNMAELKDIPPEKLKILSEKKIFFGHQSVGFNIIDGLKDIMKEFQDLKLDIRETKNIKDFDYYIFAHSTVGKNKEPFSKIDDFKNIIENGLGDKIDIAFFKFCYIDIMKNSDIKGIFNHYVKISEELKIKYPKVKFIHFTVPLRVEPRGIGIIVKRWINAGIEDDEDNIKRNLFNQMLREKFTGAGELFDLAKYQSTYGNGNQKVFIKNKKKYNVLLSDFTSDGGHLNNLGRKIIAGKLLIFLCQI